MANVDAIVTKVARVMAKMNVCDLPAYKRVVTRSGGDPLTGRGVQTATVDTLMDPPPVLSPSRNMMDLSGDALAQVGLKPYIFSAKAISRAEVQDPNLSIVFKSASGEEVLFILTYDPILMQGTDIAFNVVLSSKKR